MDLNKSIYIFTVVTVLFTPVSFLAVRFMSIFTHQALRLYVYNAPSN